MVRSKAAIRQPTVLCRMAAARNVQSRPNRRLVETAGISADKITARGADGADPVTRPDECKGQRRTPELIACLQPDRRVDVEVAGSRLQTAPMP